MKKRLSLLSILSACTGLYAETPTPSLPGEPLKSSENYPAGYNRPARITLENMPDIFVDVSFTYWDVAQDGLDLANSALFASNGPGTGYLASATSNSVVLSQNAGYTPGFKVGIGGSFHEWTLAAEYTWVRQNTHTKQIAPTASPNLGTSIWTMNNWFQQVTSLGQTIVATNVSSHWKVGIDFGDLMISRPYYQGKRLSLSPFFGIRSAWIRQKLNIDIAIPTGALPTGSLSSASSYNTSHSWALGPRAGLAADWLLPMGFKIEGDLAASLLFTQYTKVFHSEQVAYYQSIPSTLETTLSNWNCVRPIAEMGLGLGWGTYLAKQKYHIDFLASYDFLFLWDQNMIRKLMDQTVAGVASGGNGLSIQGLTLSARFDF